MISQEQLSDTVMQVLKDHPDKFNPRCNIGEGGTNACVYTSAENPYWHCLVGQVLLELGLPIPGPELISGIMSIYQRDEPGVDDLTDAYQYELTEDQAEMLSKIQSLADDGGMWGDYEDDIADILGVNQ